MKTFKKICAAVVAAAMAVEGAWLGGSAAGLVTAKAETASSGGFAIYQNRQAAPILMDASYEASSGEYAERTYTQIKRAVGDFRQDVAMVTGAVDFEEIQQIFADTDEEQAKRLSDAAIQNQVPQVKTSAANVQDENVIIIGSIADSTLIQDMVKNGKLTEAEGIENQSEAYVIKQVSEPIAGNSAVKNALVIAGSDARGTVYGIYAVSEKIGVSPWYWWSDVPVDVAGEDGEILYSPETVVEGEPSIPYRGIFINDEEQLREWAYQKKDFAWPAQVSHPGVYRHVYELLLRLKANTLWPAMHEGTQAFNCVVGEDGTELVNAKNAMEYGIIMGSSHCEMMLRNNVGEWADWYQANKETYNIKGSNSTAAWDYTINKKAILAYWEERVKSNKDFENIFSVGLRGVHDGGPALAQLNTFISNKGQENALGSDITVEGATEEAKKVALMKDVIHEQRKIIQKYYGSEDGAPQVFIPYKEMNEYYNYNNRDLANWLEKEAPDIILMWANDNFGYLRQTPNKNERAEGRRNGVYYHNSYWGWPKSYLWLNSASIAQMNSELHRAYNTGADTYWILNVGDIKPGEILAEYFMKMAWDIESADDAKAAEPLTDQAKRDFHVSQEVAEEIADCLCLYYQYNGTKRAEFYGYGNYDFSVSGNGDEGMLWVNQWNDLAARLEAVYKSLDENARDAFYEQILYAVRSSRDVAEEYIYAQKNEMAVSQGRYGSSVLYRKLGQKAIARIKQEQDDFWKLNEGKWDKVINYSHRARYREGDGTKWSGDYQPNQGILLKTNDDYKTAKPGEGVGAACENGRSAGSGTITFSSLNAERGEKHYIDVFGKAAGTAEWTAEAPEWVKMTTKSGSVYTEERITVSVDWSKVTKDTEGQIKIYNGTTVSGSPVATFTVKADITESQLTGDTKGYQEANGYVLIEAEHASDNVAGTDGTKWQTIHSLGQRGDSIRITTAEENKVNQQQGDVSDYQEFAEGTLSEADKKKAGHIAYNVYFDKAGTYDMTAYRLPTLDEYSAACRTAVVVNGNSSSNTWLRGTASTTGSWSDNILHMIEELKIKITVRQGWNTIELYRMSPSQSFDRFLIVTDAAAAPVSGSMGIGGPVSPNNLVSQDKLREFQKFRIGVLSKELEQMGGIALRDGSREVRIGRKLNLEVFQSDSGASELEWSSSDEKLATVQNGVVTGISKGSVDITVSLKQNGVIIDSDTVTVKVYGEAGDIIADLRLDGTNSGYSGAGAVASPYSKNGGTPEFPYLEIQGKSGLYFDAARWLEVTKEDGTPLMKGAKEFTVSYDVYTSSTRIDNYSFFLTNTHVDGNPTAANSSRYPRFAVMDNSNMVRILNGGQTFEAAASKGWKHVNIVYTGNEVTVYIDGEKKITNDAFEGIANILSAGESYVWIGKGPFTPVNSQLFTGYLSDFKIYNYALISSEIEEEISAGKHSHKAGADWKSNAQKHWHICSGCSEKMDEADHARDAGTVTKQATITETGEITYRCSVCGYVMEVKKTPVLAEGSGGISGDKNDKTEDKEGRVGMSLAEAKSKVLKADTDKENVPGSTFAKMKLKGAGGKKSVKLSWSKVKGANGYILYGAACGKKLKVIKELSASKKSYTVKKLKAGKYYRYVLAACRTVDGEKRVTDISSTVHVCTNGGKNGNPVSVSVSGTAKLSLKKGKSKTLKVSLKQKKKVKEHGKKFRYESSDKKVASVNVKGKVKGVKKGNCKIYVYTQNGLYKAVKVKVK